MILVQFILFAAGLVLLWKGADWLVDGGATVGKHLGISDLVIGLTLIAFGTSAPELFVNLIAVVQNKPDITFGNILGSNIANILLILGLGGLFSPMILSKKLVLGEYAWSLNSALFLGLLIVFPSSNLGLARWQGFVLLGFFIWFLVFIAINSKKEILLESSATKSFPMGLLLVSIGMVALPIGAKFTIDSAINLSLTFGISEALVSLFAIAIGTSLPELVTSVASAVKKKSDIAVGNIIGSNVFNILLVLGVCAAIKPIAFNVAFYPDLLMVIAATVLVGILLILGKRNEIGRAKASLLLLVYFAYIFATWFRSF